MLCVNAGGATVEERRRPRLQHLHGDSGGKRGAGRLGIEDFPLPQSSPSGESPSPGVDELRETKKHSWVAWAHCITTTLARPQEPHVGAEGMLGAGLSPEQLHLLQRFSPELSWDQAGTADALHTRADTDTIGFFIAKFLKNWDLHGGGGACFVCAAGNERVYIATLYVHVDKDARSTVYSICPSTAALEKTVGHIGISFINTERKGAGRGRGDGEWMCTGDCSSAHVAPATVTTQLPWRQLIGCTLRAEIRKWRAEGGHERY